MIINLNSNDNKGDIEILQKETMESMKEYIGKLIPKLNDMTIELNGELKEDTWEYLRMMIDGFNWVLEAYNGTSSIINADKSIDETAVQEHVNKLSKAFIGKDEAGTSKILREGIIPFLNEVLSRL